VSVGSKLVDQAKGGLCCSAAWYMNWVMTPTVIKLSVKQHQFSWVSEWVPVLSQSQPYHRTASCQQSSRSILSTVWRRGWRWQWGRWTDSTASIAAMDMPLLPSEQSNTHTYRTAQRKGRWTVTHKWRLTYSYRFPSVFCRNHHSAGGAD
jgi:hypothetical protein